MDDHIIINKWYRADEALVVRSLLAELDLPDYFYDKVQTRTLELINAIRKKPEHGSYVARLMQQFKLSSPQGLTLMAMAESLLRIPDAETADKLIQEKLAQGDWSKVMDKEDASLVKLSKLALVASQKVLEESREGSIGGFVKKTIAKAGAPIIRQSVKQMMMQLADEFILGSSIEKSLKRAEDFDNKGYRYSYDMLGEAAMTAADAQKYFQAYKHAIQSLAAISKNQGIHSSPGISVKLSALHPRYEFAQKHRVLEELTPSVIELARLCKEAQIALTIDAEEADVLELSLDIIEKIADEASLQGWNGFGLAIQAYQKRSLHVVEWVIDLARKTQKKLNLRLVKGAYWDTEIKRAQERGLSNYPVFTHKFYTDLSYLVCAQKLLNNRDVVFPQFATHNAYTVLSILELSENQDGYEFQRLHGMGEQLYEELFENGSKMPACRIYAPVGHYDDLLPYLVRRILENAANTSFVHHLTDLDTPAEQLAKNPVLMSKMSAGVPHPKIPLPAHIYGPERKNSHGLDLSDDFELQALYEELERNTIWEAGPIIGGQYIANGKSTQLLSPANNSDIVGEYMLAKAEHVTKAYDIAEKAFEDWSHTHADGRALCLLKYADLLEKNRTQLISLCIREAGKTIGDALAEVREAVDFCHYYALSGRKDFSAPMILQGPTGEHNQISMHARGTFVCISPWNFPLAIFTGQITAALMAGNCVIAKPAGPTPLIAHFAIKLMHEAGIPPEVLHFVPGASKDISTALLNDSRLAGVAMTGSVDTAHIINHVLIRKSGPIVPLIAETGGQNAMLVDSSALPEQVIQDVLSSAFQSAGQRCSALRMLFIQQDIADKVVDMLVGAMGELKIGNPARLSTDVGPVIDINAKSMLEKHVQFLEKKAKKLYQSLLSSECNNGTFVAPAAYELEDPSILTSEKFGPILHVLRYKAADLDAVMKKINSLHFGLTLGIHSRIEKTYQHIFKHMKVGNTYVNRNMIGAVVGVQPFGGENLSGTGPKAGGPRYLHRFATERTLSINTTAQGGNALLMSLEDEI